MSTKNVCTSHSDAIARIKKARSLIESAIKTNRNVEGFDSDELSDADYELDYAMDYILEATRAGESMESRMRDYRNAIEKLGFERVK